MKIYITLQLNGSNIFMYWSSKITVSTLFSMCYENLILNMKYEESSYPFNIEDSVG